MKFRHKILHSIFFLIRICIVLALCFMLASGTVLCLDYLRRYVKADYEASLHTGTLLDVSVTTDSFSESAAELSNPDRGTYLIYGFAINDQDVDYNTLVGDKLKNDHSNTIAMIQINLRHYSTGDISTRGLEHIAALFDALRSITDKRFLVRFLYDWDGKNIASEPRSLDIILNHIRQLEPILRDNSDQIFVLQGLFLGNWGEMNGSRYLNNDCYRQLAATLASVTDDSNFLAVRIPAHWRGTTELADISEDILASHPYAWRFGLYNDAIMGNMGDYGTYGTQSRTEAGDLGLWNRAEELAFQNQLCRYVPNGGEVITDNTLNDFENAIPTMRQMRLTYFNEDYDKNVFKKWQQTTIGDGSVYDGMDGYTYAKLHLGYRLLIDSADLTYKANRHFLSVQVNMRNAGFAPLYGSKEGRLILHHIENNTYYVYAFEEDITALSRTDSEKDIFSLQLRLPLSELPAGTYTASFQLWDNDTDRQLQLAIETPQTALGYRIGAFTIVENEDPYTPEYPTLPSLPFDLDSRIEDMLRPPFDEPTSKLWQLLKRMYQK